MVDITGEVIVQRRKALGLSRDAFAQLVGIRPGALWRMEVRDVFKSGEREHLAAVADRWLTCAVPAASSSVPRAAKVQQPKVSAKSIAVIPEDASPLLLEDDEELVQWADPLRLDRRLQLSQVFPLDAVSPTTLSLTDGLRRVSNSEVQTFKRCRRKWWLAYYRGLRSKYEPPYGARATGTRGHAALAAWYRPDGEERIDPRDALEIIVDAERARLEALPDVSEETLRRFNKDVELERVIIDGYVRWLAETGADADYTVVGSEQYLEAALPEVENTLIVGRLDARVVRSYDNARLFIDHKFVASIQGAARLLPLNEQMLWYILLEELQPDRDPDQRVAGALYNMLRRSKQTEKASPPFYERIEVRHNRHEINSFRKRLVGVLDDMKYCREELDAGETDHHHLVVYPTPTRDCAWDCPFFKVCPMFDDGSRVDDALEDHYTVDDPYGYYYLNPIEKSEE